MALSDLEVFSEFAYSAKTELLNENINLFNAASGGTLQLIPTAHQGDFSDEVFYKSLGDIVKRRNAYGSGAVAEMSLSQDLETSVKVGAGSKPIRLDPGQFKWIQRSPEEAGAAFGMQLAEGAMKDMINMAVGSTHAALSSESEVVNDASAATLTRAGLLGGTRKFGDAAGDISLWVIHSSPMNDLFVQNDGNLERLFNYGTVNIQADAFGRRFLMSDIESLVEADGVSSGVDKFHTLGLTAGAATIGQNNDFTDNFETKNGDENIIRTYQSEWSYNVNVKGFSWDKTNGGKSPTDAAILTSTNWDRHTTSHKDLAGVVVESR